MLLETWNGKDMEDHNHHYHITYYVYKHTYYTATIPHTPESGSDKRTCATDHCLSKKPDFRTSKVLPAIWGISHQYSVTLSPHTLADHFLLLGWLQQQAPLCVWKLANEMVSLHISFMVSTYRRRIWYLPRDFPIWSCWQVLLPTYTHSHTFTHCVSSCSLAALDWL